MMTGIRHKVVHRHMKPDYHLHSRSWKRQCTIVVDPSLPTARSQVMEGMPRTICVHKGATVDGDTNDELRRVNAL